ncbi:ASKHA domain-containing protein [Bacteroidota bacterium]
MVELKIHYQDRIDSLEVEENAILLHVLRENGYEIYSPCGGNGTCGKCRVWLKGEGSVSSCVYRVSRTIEIILPDPREARILSEQHTHTISVPFMPGPISDLSAYPHGIAIDLGTTSLVFHMVNLVTGSVIETRTALNPQSKYGADVISRISYASENKGGLSELQSVILGAFNDQIERLLDSSEISGKEIVKITIAGNTTMLHLLLGVDPLPIALAPFTPKFTDEQILSGKDLHLICNPEGMIKLLPSVSAYVGADIVAGLASIQPSEDRNNYLFMDIGTNGELALVTAGSVICCSAAAGPAFEGAGISCGMGGMEGAISVYDREGYTVIGDGPPAGICGSGLIDLVAYMIEEGIVDKRGLLKEDFIVESADKTESGSPVSITQQDIREVQLAKSAVAAGINVLIDHAGLTVNDIDTVYLAGGFGNYINPASAVKIGLIPSELSDRIIPLGNTSGTGALLALKSTQFDSVIDDLLAKTQYLELSGHDGFTTEFALNMDF